VWVLAQQTSGFVRGSFATVFGSKKEIRWTYREAHWVFFVDLLLIVLVRAGFAKHFVRGLARSGMALRAFYRRWRRGHRVHTEFVQVSNTPDLSTERTSSGRADTEGLTPFGNAPPAPLPSTTRLPNPGLDHMVAVAQAPFMICLVLSMVCHVVVVVLELLANTKWPAIRAVAGDAIWRIWIAQLINYTLNFGWFVMRLLNARLGLSRSRPLLAGDLSELKESVPTTSMRFAQEAGVTQVARVIIITSSGLLCLRHVGVDIGRLLALTSLSGVIFSFVVGDIAANLFGGFVLYITQPFAQGDWVQSADGGTDGWIRNLGWYYTTVIDWEKRPHYIPNSTFSSVPIVNCSRMTHRRILIEGPLRFWDMNKVEDIVADVRKLINNHNDVDKDMHRLCGVKQVTEFSVTLWISCYTKHIPLRMWLQVQESLLLGLCAILRKYNTNWATNLERLWITPKVQGEAELASEFRRLLNARSALVTHEESVKVREAKLQEQQEELDVRRSTVDTMMAESENNRDLLEQQAALLETKKVSLAKRRKASEVKKESVAGRERSLVLMEKCRTLFETEPETAIQWHQEALALRESSVQMAWVAVRNEREAIESEQNVLQQEKELLERKRSSEEVEAGGPTKDTAEDTPTPTLDKADASPDAQQGQGSAPSQEDDPPPPAAEDDPAADEREQEEREQVALAIGGE